MPIVNVESSANADLHEKVMSTINMLTTSEYSGKNWTGHTSFKVNGELFDITRWFSPGQDEDDITLPLYDWECEHVQSRKRYGIIQEENESRDYAVYQIAIWIVNGLWKEDN